MEQLHVNSTNNIITLQIGTFSDNLVTDAISKTKLYFYSRKKPDCVFCLV